MKSLLNLHERIVKLGSPVTRATTPARLLRKGHDVLWRWEAREMVGGVTPMHNTIRIKRAYQEPDPDDGYRVLVDRLWPRGVGKEQLKLDGWLKEIAPSRELRRWFGHDPARWQEFQRRYREELSAPERQGLLAELAERARVSALTLVYGARDPEHNDAVVLKALLEQKLRQSRDTAPSAGSSEGNRAG